MHVSRWKFALNLKAIGLQYLLHLGLSQKRERNGILNIFFAVHFPFWCYLQDNQARSFTFGFLWWSSKHQSKMAQQFSFRLGGRKTSNCTQCELERAEKCSSQETFEVGGRRLYSYLYLYIFVFVFVYICICIRTFICIYKICQIARRAKGRESWGVQQEFFEGGGLRLYLYLYLYRYLYLYLYI